MQEIAKKIEKNSRYILPAVLFLILLLYGQSIFFKLVLLDDDEIVLSYNPAHSALEKIIQPFGNSYLKGHYYRPLTNLSYLLDSAASGRNPSAFHISNIIIHILTVIALYYLLMQIGYAKVTILPPILLFALSPLQLNAVGWIAGRADLLACLFSLLMFTLFLKFRENSKPGYILLFFLFMFSAFISKENTIITPFLVIIFSPLMVNKPDSDKRHIPLSIIIIAITIIFLLIKTILSGSQDIGRISISNLNSLWIIPETAAKFFIPAGIKTLSDYSPALTITGLILLMLLFIIPLRIKEINKRKYYFGFIWFIVLMLPGIIIDTKIFNEFYYWDCRSYLSSAGLIIMSSEIIGALFKKYSMNRIIKLSAPYFLIIFIASFYYLGDYANPLSFWNDTVNNYPERYLPNAALYKYYTMTDNFDKAEYYRIRAIKYSPDIKKPDSTAAPGQ